MVEKPNLARLLVVIASVSLATGTASAAILPPGECAGIIGIGYGNITIQPDRGDGKVHGHGVFQTDYDKRRGVPPPPGNEFIGEPKSDGSVDLYRLDRTLWFDAVRV